MNNFHLQRQRSSNAQDDRLSRIVDCDEERRFTDVYVIGDVDDVDIFEVTHLLVGREVAAAAVVFDDDAFKRFRTAARKTLAAPENSLY